MMKVGMVLHPGSHWLGGRNYFRNLLTAVRCLPDSVIEPIIFTGKVGGDAFGDFPPLEVVQSRILDSRSLAWFLRKAVTAVSSRDWLLEVLLQQHGAAVLSHSGHLGTGARIATVGWIPDFQFVHLPEFYSREERLKRIRISMELCERCDTIVVSSESAKNDLHSFAPKCVAKVEVLRFVASPIPDEGIPTLSELGQRYRFDQPYFLLPNQFWAHKNHRVVITALKLLKREGRRLLVLATGSTADLRNPDFFGSLMHYAAECDVLDSFRVLGIIPFSDLAGLMRHSAALINPSRFEGWSTSVEESKSAGKKVLLSDIPVHREQAPEFGVYFPPDDAEATAEVLWATWQSFDSETDLARQNQARKAFPDRQRDFAKRYQNILLAAASRYI